MAAEHEDSANDFLAGVALGAALCGNKASIAKLLELPERVFSKRAARLRKAIQAADKAEMRAALGLDAAGDESVMDQLWERLAEIGWRAVIRRSAKEFTAAANAPNHAAWIAMLEAKLNEAKGGRP